MWAVGAYSVEWDHNLVGTGCGMNNVGEATCLLLMPQSPLPCPMLLASRHAEALKLEAAGFTPKFVTSGYADVAFALAACKTGCL